MARTYYQGRYKLRNPQKYIGDPNNIIFRSSWEVRFSIWCDLNPSVISWGSEEFSINYIKPTDGKVHRYFPDYIMKIKTKDGNIETWVVEIKPYSQSVPPVVTPRKKKKTLLEEQTTFLINQAKWKAMKAYCAKVGWKFRVVTEKELGI